MKRKDPFLNFDKIMANKPPLWFEVKPKGIKDHKKAILMTEIANYMYAPHHEFIEALTSARVVIEEVYGITTQDNIWEKIMNVVLRNYEIKEKK